MIWLIKTKEMKTEISTKGLKHYLLKSMEPADKYIKSINPSKINPQIQTNVKFHLYQLMEVYVTCRLIEYWLTLQSEDDKEYFFFHLNDTSFLKSICDYEDLYCSQFEYKSFPESMKTAIHDLFTENLNDVKKAFSDCIDGFQFPTIDNDLSKSDAFSSILSFYVNQGVWASLRIVPTSWCKFENIIFHDETLDNYDYITNPIMTFNKKLELELVSSNSKFYHDSAKDCFLFLLELAQKLYDSDIEIRINTIEAEVITLKAENQERKKDFVYLQTLFYNYINNEKPNRKIEAYKKLSKNELVNLFYSTYQVQDNFLEVLQTHPFEDKIILSEDYEIKKGYQALLLTYLDIKVVESRKDMALLKVLFSLKGKNPEPAKTQYVNRMEEFEKFLKTYKNK